MQQAAVPLCIKYSLLKGSRDQKSASHAGRRRYKHMAAGPGQRPPFLERLRAV